MIIDELSTTQIMARTIACDETESVRGERAMTGFTALQRTFLVVSVSIVLAVFATTSVQAWHARGHTDVGAVADHLLARGHHAHALERVHAILGNVTLAQSGPWADCVRSVSGPPNFGYTKTDVLKSGQHTPCYGFSHNSRRLREMRQYAERNWANVPECSPPPGQGCHTQFHFADISLDRPGYADGEVGTRSFDIVHAINAAVAVLRSEPCNRARPGTGEVVGQPPFHFTCRDALMMLVHLVGDLHQPLHVGSVYLAPDGTRVDPDSSPAARLLAEQDGRNTTGTRGGNSLHWLSTDLHTQWDTTRGDRPNDPDIPTDDELDGVAATAGPPDRWAELWATESVGEARRAFQHLRFAEEPVPPTAHGREPRSRAWIVSRPPAHGLVTNASFAIEIAPTQHRQIVLAGARLAQLLLSIWPD